MLGAAYRRAVRIPYNDPKFFQKEAMADTVIKSMHMGLIVERIQEGRCVPFLGGGCQRQE
jgi:hypothetical protein